MSFLGAWSVRRLTNAPESRDRSIALALFGAQLAIGAFSSPAILGRRHRGVALAFVVANAAALGGYVYFASKVDALAAAAALPNLARLGLAGEAQIGALT
jgi:hypothetical protein